uniref:Restriction alleviation protein, Lar family n=1 Tax=Cereibacter sphaeroides (strain ATCC 17025 / ATH 2.4.3) TaxID=349102 RepID=A4WTA9_CERS5
MNAGDDLKPCPFCGGTAQWFNFDDDCENAGGSAIECSGCGAASHVEFGRKENLASSWNRRAHLAEAAADVLAERARQISAEGWTPEHDDGHSRGQMATAAGCYILHQSHLGDELEVFWPWEMTWWKPTDRRRDLVKAAALLLAEIERLDRAEARAKTEATHA